MDGKEDQLQIMLNELTRLKNELNSINKKTGAIERAIKMREEILNFGWQHVVKNYHPDVNISDPAANELFRMYKYIYDDMKRKFLA